ncbi:ATP-binding protein, partial [bacterium M00.F.Ca.ET.230.01.1.1]
MDYFPIITSICRASMGSPSVAVINNIKKLIKALEKDNKFEEANKLKDILDSQSLKAELKPSRVSLSKYYFEGERMPEGIKPPVDKESGNYLAEIIFPKNLVDMRPIFDLTLNNSIDYLLEEWMNIEHLNTNNVKPAYSVMLFGEPGTGKTLLAQYLAKKLELPLITAKLDGLLSSFLGTTARNISNLFSFANRYKCVLLLDEFDSIAKLRDDPNELGELKRVVNTL